MLGALREQGAVFLECLGSFFVQSLGVGSGGKNRAVWPGLPPKLQQLLVAE